MDYDYFYLHMYGECSLCKSNKNAKIMLTCENRINLFFCKNCVNYDVSKLQKDMSVMGKCEAKIHCSEIDDGICGYFIIYKCDGSHTYNICFDCLKSDVHLMDLFQERI